MVDVVVDVAVHGLGLHANGGILGVIGGPRVEVIHQMPFIAAIMATTRAAELGHVRMSRPLTFFSAMSAVLFPSEVPSAGESVAVSISCPAALVGRLVDGSVPTCRAEHPAQLRELDLGVLPDLRAPG